MKKMILPTLKILSVLLNNHAASASASSSASMIGICASTMPAEIEFTAPGKSMVLRRVRQYFRIRCILERRHQNE